MEAKVGDRLVVNSRHVGQPAQTGEITEIIGIGGQHFRVRWSDGRESVVPSAFGARGLSALPTRTPRARTGRLMFLR